MSETREEEIGRLKQELQQAQAMISALRCKCMQQSWQESEIERYEAMVATMQTQLAALQGAE